MFLTTSHPRLTLVAVLTLFSSIYTHAQDDFRPGYLVTAVHDTIHGYIDYGNPKQNAKYCLFRQNDEARIQRYNPMDLLFYQYEGSKKYVSKSVVIDGQVQVFFFEYLLDGIIELYFLAHIHDDYFYLEKNGVLYELSDRTEVVETDQGLRKRYVNHYSGTLKSIMKDAPSLMENIDDMELSYNSLISLSRSYHDLICTDGTPCIVYSKREEKLHDISWKFRLGVAFTVTKAKMSIRSRLRQRRGYSFGEDIGDVAIRYMESNFFNSFSEQQYLVSYESYPSLLLNVSNRWNTSLQLEAQYEKISIERGQASFRSDFWKGVIAVHKEFFFYNKLRPFAEVGVTVNYYTNHSLNDLDFTYGIPYVERGEVKFEPTNSHIESKETSYNPASWGVMLSAGLLQELKNGQKIFLEVGYETHAKLSNATIDPEFRASFHSRLDAANFTIGFML